ncbi:MAG: hypothetical protein ACJ788_27085 [Ktedonobacteraceae bacterium]|jgi:hypothetical protein
MLTFLFAFGLLAVLVAIGVYISVYLYNGGAIGDRRFRRFRRKQPVEASAASEDDNEDQEYMEINPADDSTARYARAGVMAFFGGFMVLILLVTTFINGALH